MKITDDKSRIERILKYIDYCIILHNFLIACDDDADHEWLYKEEDTSDADDSTRAPTAVTCYIIQSPKEVVRMRGGHVYKDILSTKNTFH